jgi:hypothetical protein
VTVDIRRGNTHIPEPDVAERSASHGTNYIPRPPSSTLLKFAGSQRQQLMHVDLSAKSFDF